MIMFCINDQTVLVECEYFTWIDDGALETNMSVVIKFYVNDQSGTSPTFWKPSYF